MDGSNQPANGHREGSDVPALLVGYGLIVPALWMARPWQDWLGWNALAWVTLQAALDFKGLESRTLSMLSES